MVAIMEYKCGLQFSGVVCEDKETAERWIKEQGGNNPRAYEILPVCFITKNLKVK